jgi:hypothetical protein
MTDMVSLEADASELGTDPVVDDTVSENLSEPWPDDHVPATDGERCLWRAFNRLRAVETGPMGQSAVAREAKMSRTPLSQKEEGFVLLRKAIRDEVHRRKVQHEARQGKAAKPTPAERAAAREATRTEKIDYWKAVAQVSDSALVEAVARAVRAEGARIAAIAMLQRILADFKAGRWVMADHGAVVLGEIESFLANTAAGARTANPVSAGQATA